MSKDISKKLKKTNPFYIFVFFFNNLIKLLKKHFIIVLILLAVLISSFIVLWPVIHKNIKPGHVGVIFKPFFQGIDLNYVAPEGINFKLPWNNIISYNARIQKHQLKLEVITADLLKSNITVVFQYEIDKNNVPLLHRYLGEDYLDKVIIPERRSETAFSKDILVLAENISINVDEVIINNINPPGVSQVRLIRISDVQITDIQFPKVVQDAIQNKIVQRAKLEAYEFILKSSEKEAERKAIEASGIKAFQDIIQNGLTTNYLRWKGIDASEKLASSPNAKIVIFGQGNASLPIILGDLDRNPIGKNVLNKIPISDNAIEDSSRKVESETKESY
jgi:regulator of protease activity HflC (stomatin/prohibitin superfamily)